MPIYFQQSLTYLKSLFSFHTPVSFSKSHILFNIARNLAELDGGNFGPNSSKSSFVVACPNFLHSNMINSRILLTSSREFASETNTPLSSLSFSSLFFVSTSLRTLILLRRSLEDTADDTVVPCCILVCTLPAREPSKWLPLLSAGLLFVSVFSFCSGPDSIVFFF